MHKIKNLLTNGCSFTSDSNGFTWATKLQESSNFSSYQNIAASGAGNEYICNSTIHYLESTTLTPEETLVIVMWSGTGRKDISVTGEVYYQIVADKQHGCGANFNNLYYLFSGGLTNSWTKNTFTDRIFNSMYKVSDPLVLCLDSLLNFIKLEQYLKSGKYHYVFTNYINYWNPNIESCHGGDYSIGFFCNEQLIYKNFDFSNWFFIDEHKNCLGEYAKSVDLLDHTGHPTKTCNEMFADLFVLPELKKRFNLY